MIFALVEYNWVFSFVRVLKFLLLLRVVFWKIRYVCSQFTSFELGLEFGFDLTFYYAII